MQNARLAVRDIYYISSDRNLECVLLNEGRSFTLCFADQSNGKFLDD